MANVYGKPGKVNSLGGGYSEIMDEDGDEDDPKTLLEWAYLIGTLPAQIVMIVCRATCPTFEDFDSNGWNSKLSVFLTLSTYYTSCLTNLQTCIINEDEMIVECILQNFLF